MDLEQELSRVRALSDGELLSGLAGVLRASRRAVAEVIAHLGEVEQRRLHLLAGYGSMFAYCVSRLAMSEDEACRRIDVARLVRRFPLLYARLAGGHVSLSVAALLKPHLTQALCPALLDAVSGKTVWQAREVLAAWFPQPDVVASIRKLPTRSAPDATPGDKALPCASVELPRIASVDAPSQTQATLPPDGARPLAPRPDAVGARVSPAPASTDAGNSARNTATALPPARSPSRCIQPLSPERYKLQLTASTELKRKLELARDLMRHAIPSGDLATIVERALDTLLDQVMKRRFGATARPKTSPPSTMKRRAASEAPAQPPRGHEPLASSHEPPPNCPEPAHAAPSAYGPSDRPAPPPHGHAPSANRAELPPKCPEPAHAAPSARGRHLPNSVRRAVLSRDGLRCTWQGPDGVCCNERAWLEHDHVIPRALGGSNEPFNIRPLCRAHNRLAAELAFGQNTIARVIAGRRARRTRAQTNTSAESAEPTEHAPARSPQRTPTAADP